jgi:hypothetical protein
MIAHSLTAEKRDFEFPVIFYLDIFKEPFN